MNAYVRRYFRKFSDEELPLKLFHEVIPLNEAPHVTFEEASAKTKDLPKGWYELSRLGTADRINFTRDYWQEHLPFIPHVNSFLQKFFSKLDDVGIFLTQTTFDAPFMTEFVLSVRDGSCFFRGATPASKRQVESVKAAFQGALPDDYLDFVQIHNGFARHTERGVLPLERLKDAALYLQKHWDDKSMAQDPKELIPFYEAAGEEAYQCFFAGWSPEGRVGNVYYNMREKMISDVKTKELWLENLAFPSFLDWLVFYLEGVE